jgi:hypothetical protein
MYDYFKKLEKRPKDECESPTKKTGKPLILILGIPSHGGERGGKILSDSETN